MTPRRLLLALCWAWLALVVALPLGIVLVLAFARAAPGLPPFELAFSGGNFSLLVADGFYLRAFVRSLGIAALATMLCLLLGYPLAYGLSRAPAAWRGALLTAVMLPFWTGFLLRVSAWIGLLREDGWINAALGALGVPGAPFPLLYSELAMQLGLVHVYLPFLVLPLYARLSAREVALEEAASDLGAGKWTVFRRVTLPLSLPGVAAGSALVFIPVCGEYVVPELLGGPGAETLGRVLWAEFFANRDWPMAAALAVAMLFVLLLPLALWRWRAGREMAG
jgi:putrescine transport system permease protein